MPKIESGQILPHLSMQSYNLHEICLTQKGLCAAKVFCREHALLDPLTINNIVYYIIKELNLHNVYYLA